MRLNIVIPEKGYWLNTPELPLLELREVRLVPVQNLLLILPNRGENTYPLSRKGAMFEKTT